MYQEEPNNRFTHDPILRAARRSKPKAKKIGLGQLQAYVVSDELLKKNRYLNRVKSHG